MLIGDTSKQNDEMEDINKTKCEIVVNTEESSNATNHLNEGTAIDPPSVDPSIANTKRPSQRRSPFRLGKQMSNNKIDAIASDNNFKHQSGKLTKQANAIDRVGRQKLDKRVSSSSLSNASDKSQQQKHNPADSKEQEKEAIRKSSNEKVNPKLAALKVTKTMSDNDLLAKLDKIKTEIEEASIEDNENTADISLLESDNNSEAIKTIDHENLGNIESRKSSNVSTKSADYDNKEERQELHDNETKIKNAVIETIIGNNVSVEERIADVNDNEECTDKGLIIDNYENNGEENKINNMPHTSSLDLDVHDDNTFINVDNDSTINEYNSDHLVSCQEEAIAHELQNGKNDFEKVNQQPKHDQQIHAAAVDIMTNETTAVYNNIIKSSNDGNIVREKKSSLDKETNSTDIKDKQKSGLIDEVITTQTQTHMLDRKSSNNDKKNSALKKDSFGRDGALKRDSIGSKSNTNESLKKDSISNGINKSGALKKDSVGSEIKKKSSLKKTYLLDTNKKKISSTESLKNETLRFLSVFDINN